MPALIQCAEPRITSLTLKNGMKLIVEEDHDIPNAAMYLFFKVGSRNERPGTTGISHFFEHMMFNGAKKYGPKQFDVEMEKAGGRNNAYTSRDLTVYTDFFPTTALRLMFDMEADRIRDLSFNPKIIESERGVVASERQTGVDNSNPGMLYEQLNAAAYTAHPYGWPVIGWASDIESWTIEDLKTHFRMGYAPNNCVVVVVGAVATAEVMELAREFLEPIPKQEPPPVVRTVEPPQRGERRVIVRKQAQLPLQMISYHVPAASHADFVPLELLATVLTQGRSSRLYRRLVDKDQLTLDAEQFMSPQLDPGQMIFSFSPRAGVDPAAVEKALYEELERVRTIETSAEELRKAKNLMLTDIYRGMKTIAGRADLLGKYEIYRGDYKELFASDKLVEAVTSADILRVARKYLTANNRTVATLVPEEPAGVKQ
jgi:zinc protease